MNRRKTLKREKINFGIPLKDDIEMFKTETLMLNNATP